MSDGSLSQDEIDALLQGSGGMDFDEESAFQSSLTDQQVTAFGSLLSQTTDSQGSNISMLTNRSVTLEKPQVQRMQRDQLFSRLEDQLVQIRMDYSEGVTGEHSYLLSNSAALAIAGPMMGQEDVDLDDAAVNALQEAFSQVSGPVATTLGEKVGATVMSNPPEGQIVPKTDLSLPGGDFVLATYSMNVDGRAIQIMEIYGASVVQAVAEDAGGQVAGGTQQPPGQAAAVSGQQQDPFGGLMGGGAAPAGAQGGQGAGQGPSVQGVQFPNLQQGAPQSGEQGNISLLMDVYMEMTVELGRTRKLIKEILGMGEGTIIELDKLAGEPVDILVNHKLIAKGEVVVIDENFGVRVTEIISPMERVSNMT